MRRLSTRRRDERGAIAMITALLAVVLLGMAAMAVDLSSLSNERQQLHDTTDTAALSGSMLLPDGVAAKAKALEVAAKNDPDAPVPAVTFYCITGATATTPPAVNTQFIPGACNPGAAPYTAATYPGLRCNASICAIPCFPGPPQNDACNAIQVGDTKDVPFSFAPVLGISDGSTGSVNSTACKGGCGSLSTSPIDVAVIADRTSSMSDPAFNAVKAGVQGMLKVFNPAMTQVAFGMNSMSTGSGTCVTAPASNNTSGYWFPIKNGTSNLFNDYLSSTSPPTVNATSPLVKGMSCMTQSNGLGTWLSAPIDAAQDLLTTDPKRNATAKRAIVYMTDGDPNEGYTSGRRSLGQRNAQITSSAKAWGSTDSTQACNNATTAASDAKATGTIVVTIAYDVDSTTCGSKKLLDQLASMASPVNGVASTSNGCSTSALVTAENADGDYFFCAAQPADLAPIFTTVAGSVAGNSRLVWMP